MKKEDRSCMFQNIDIYIYMCVRLLIVDWRTSLELEDSCPLK